MTLEELRTRMAELTEEAVELGSQFPTEANDAAMFRNITEGIAVMEQLIELGDSECLPALTGARLVLAGYRLFGMHA